MLGQSVLHLLTRWWCKQAVPRGLSQAGFPKWAVPSVTEPVNLLVSVHNKSSLSRGRGKFLELLKASYTSPPGRPVYTSPPGRPVYTSPPSRPVYTSPPGRPVHSNANSISLGSIQSLCTYCSKQFDHMISS